MLDDIAFKLGLDAKGFQRAVTSIKAQVSDLAKDWKSKLIAGISVAALVDRLQNVSAEMRELKRNAEDVGSSLGFLITLRALSEQFGGAAEDANNAMMKLAETIGQARTEGGAAEQKFTRFGVALYDAGGTAKTTEQIFKSIATVYKSTEDAALRAAIAVEFFGKTGRNINNILGEGGDGIDAFKEKLLGIAVGFGAVEAGVLSSFKSGFGKLGRAWDAIVARVIAGYYVIGKVATAPFRMKSFIDELNAAGDELLAFEQKAKGFGEKQQEDSAKQAKARQEIRDIDEQILKTRRESEAESASDDEIEKSRKKVELAKIELNILEENLSGLDDELKRKQQLLKIEEQTAKVKQAEREKEKVEAEKQKKRNEQGLEFFQKIVGLFKARAEAARVAIDAKAEVQAAKEARFEFSLEELAAADPRKSGRFAKSVQQAKEVKRLEAQAQWQNVFGTVEQRDRFQAQADAMRAGIMGLKEGDKRPFAALEREQKKAVAELVKLGGAVKDGKILTIPVMGE